MFFFPFNDILPRFLATTSCYDFLPRHLSATSFEDGFFFEDGFSEMVCQ